MKISASKVLKKVKEEREANKRGRVSLYLNLRVYKKFQMACGKEPASSVIEALMSEFIESQSASRK